MLLELELASDAVLTHLISPPQVEGTQHVVGMLRDQEKRNVFSPVNSPEKREFQFADIAQMASTTGSQPVLVDATFGATESML